MARLKGGKLFLDLTSYGDVTTSDINVSLTSEEIIAIMDKGLVIRATFQRKDLTLPFVITRYDEEDSGDIMLKYRFEYCDADSTELLFAFEIHINADNQGYLTKYIEEA